MARVDEQFDRTVQPDTPDGEVLQVALLLIKAYENEHYAMPASDPIEAIRLKMEQIRIFFVLFFVMLRYEAS